MVLTKLTESASLLSAKREDRNVQSKCATSDLDRVSRNVSDSLSFKHQAPLSKTSHLGRASLVEDGSSK